jgi:hypothetical protein
MSIRSTTFIDLRAARHGHREDQQRSKASGPGEHLEDPTLDESDPSAKVCAASKDDWVTYIKAKSQALMSPTMHLKD